MAILKKSTVIEKHNIKIIGEGTPMLFAHGFGCNQDAWRYVAPAFATSHQIILFDYIGAGTTDPSYYTRSKYDTLNGYADDVIAICNELDISNGIFVGHSVAAMIGVLASIRAPKAFDKLVFVGPSPCYVNKGNYTGGFEQGDIDVLLELMDDNFIHWSGNMAPAIMGSKNEPVLQDELTESFCNYNAAIAKHFARVTFSSDNRKDLAKVTAKSLTLQCSEDIIAPMEVGEYVHQHTPGNLFKLLNATGHCPHMSAPQEVIAAIREFVSESSIQK